MWVQKELSLRARSRGFHLISEEILGCLTEIGDVKIGMLNVFIKHTSAGLCINENADPDVRVDFEAFFSRLVKEDEPYYEHVLEGSDDLPAHIKASLLGTSINIPVSNGKLNVGLWQGIYLCEHRNEGGARQLVLTLNGEWV